MKNLLFVFLFSISFCVKSQFAISANGNRLLVLPKNNEEVIHLVTRKELQKQDSITDMKILEIKQELQKQDSVYLYSLKSIIDVVENNFVSKRNKKIFKEYLNKRKYFLDLLYQGRLTYDEYNLLIKIQDFALDLKTHK